MARDILTDDQWEQPRPLLPPQKPARGHYLAMPIIAAIILCLQAG